jgi:hypothetical protein
MNLIKSAVTGFIIFTSLNVYAADYNELNGLRVRAPGQAETYLIDQGQRRWIPNPETFNNLFSGEVTVSIDSINIPRGPDMTNGAILAQCNATVFLIDNNVKRGISSPAVMEKYGFNWGQVQSTHCILLDFIQNGPTITE